MGPVGGGVPIWLMQMMRRIEHRKYRFDFLVHTEEPQAFDSEVEALGGRIFRCPSPKKLWSYSRSFQRVVREGGPFDVVHSHVLFAGHVLRQARKSGIRVRIAHSHSDTRGFLADGHWLQGMYLTLTNRWVHRDATHGLACSSRAAAALFGKHWLTDPRWKVLFYGLDTSPFRSTVDGRDLRAGLGIPLGVPVIGHVGRFQAQKNHQYLFRVFAELARLIPDCRLLLIGDGPLREELRELAQSLSISDRIVWAGMRADVPQLMSGVMDCLVLPSCYEGLPLVGIEAQAAGLPLVVSDTVASELDVTPDVIRLPLHVAPRLWADAIALALAKPRPDRREGINAVTATFGVDSCLKSLTEFYRCAVRGNGRED